MHKWSNGQNFISSWAPWHRFRWFVLASSLALVQKKPDPWHSFFRRAGSAPAWCPISLLCFSKEFTDETRCKYPSKGPGAIRHCSPVLCGDTSSQCPSKKRHVHVAASHVRKQALYLFQSNETFCVFQNHGVFTVTAGDEVLVLPLHVSRKKLSIKTLLVSSHPGGFIASGSFGNKLKQDSVSGLSPGAMQHCFQTTEQFCRWLLNMQRKLNDSFEYP